jgi:peptidoglycan/LPS O-acetylase OafA/YrhL
MWTLHLEVAFYLLYLFVWKFKPRIHYLLIGTAICALVSPFIESHLLRIFGYFFLWLAGLKLAINYLRKPTLEAFQKQDWKWFWAALLSAIGYTTVNVIQVVLKPFWIYGTGYLSLVSVVVISGCLMTIISVPLGLRIRRLYKFSIILSFFACAGAIVHSLIHHRWADFHEYPLASAYLLLALVGFVWGSNVSAQRILERLTWLGAISYALYIVQNPIENFVFSRTPLSWSIYSWWAINLIVVALTFAFSAFLENTYQPWIGSRLKGILLKRS